MRNNLVHFEIHTANVKAAKAFYGQLFDWDINDDNPMNYGMVNTGEGSLSGGMMNSPDAPMVTFYVSVDDIEASMAKAVEMGGKVIMQPREGGRNVMYGLIADPEGNVVGLAQMADGQP